MGNFLGFGIQENENIANTYATVTNLISPEAASRLGENVGKSFEHGTGNLANGVVHGTANIANGVVQGTANLSAGFERGTGRLANGVVEGTSNLARGFDKGTLNLATGFEHGTGNLANGVVQGTANLAGGFDAGTANLANGVVKGVAIYGLTNVLGNIVGAVGQYFAARKMGMGLQKMGESHHKAAVAVAGSVDHAAQAHVHFGEKFGHRMVEASQNTGVKAAALLAYAMDKASLRFFYSVLCFGIFAMCCALIVVGHVGLAFLFLASAIVAFNAREIIDLSATMRKSAEGRFILWAVTVVTVLATGGFVFGCTDAYYYVYYYVGASMIETDLLFRALFATMLFIIISLLVSAFQRVYVSMPVALRRNENETRLSVSVESISAIVFGILLACGAYILIVRRETSV